MYWARKKFSFEAAHALISAKNSPKCLTLHGHSYIVILSLAVDSLNDEGMVIDFAVLSKLFEPLRSELDHSVINPVVLKELGISEPANPTAENIAAGIWFYITKHLRVYAESGGDDIKRYKIFSVSVLETAKCGAQYIDTFPS